MYSTAFWYLFVVLLVFLACVKPKYICIGFTHARSRASKVHFRSTEGQTFYRSIMTANDSIECRCVNSGMTGQVGGFQTKGLSASVSFLSFPPPPYPFTCAIFLAVFDSCSSFFPHKPHRNLLPRLAIGTTQTISCRRAMIDI